MTSSIRKLKDSKIEITIELDKNDLAAWVERAERQLAENLKVSGFRPGKMPKEMLRKSIGEDKIRQEALNLAISGSLISEVKKNDLQPIGREEVEIKENTSEKFIFKTVLMVMPEVKIGKYKNLSLDDSPGATEELGDDKEKQKKKKRIKILEKIKDDSRLDIPEFLVEARLQEMIQEFDSELHSRGLELSLYLAQIKKTQEDIKKEWRQRVVSQLKDSVIIKKIAEEENINIVEEEVEEEMTSLMKQFLNLNGQEALKDVDTDRLRNNLARSLLNEKVLRFLEQNN